MTIWRRRSMIYRSSLSIDECIEHLMAAMDKDSRFLPTVIGSRPVIGMVEDHKFRLRKRRFHSDRSPTQVLHGTLYEDQAGTRIETHFDLLPLEKGFWILWLAMIGTWSLDSSHDSTLLLIGGGAFIVMLLWSQFFDQNEKRYLQRFLVGTLTARRINKANADQ